MSTLVESGFAERDIPDTNRKEKSYRITEKGEMVFRFGSDPAASMLVKTARESLWITLTAR